MYEVGDKVVYQGADKNAYKKVGVLKSIEEKDGKPQLTVEFDNGETFTAPVDDWSREFTNACNAKFKVGDTVEVHTTSGGEINAPVVRKGTVAKMDNGNGRVVVDYKDGWGYQQQMFCKPSEIVRILSNSCTSTNSVVRNAIAANRRIARNAEFFDSKEFGNHDVKTEIGDYGKGTGYHISIYTDGLTSSSSWGDKGKKCIAEAKQSLAVMQRKTSALKQAISWMEQNAK